MDRINNVYEVTTRLCGMITPYGDADVDAVRLQNLNDTISVAQRLIADITTVSYMKTNEPSQIVDEAKKFVDRLCMKGSDELISGLVKHCDIIPRDIAFDSSTSMWVRKTLNHIVNKCQEFNDNKTLHDSDMNKTSIPVDEYFGGSDNKPSIGYGDLRVGNLVYESSSHNIIKVESISEHGINLCIADDDYYCPEPVFSKRVIVPKYRYDELKPIPITEELLLKLEATKRSMHSNTYYLGGIEMFYIDGVWVEELCRNEINGLHHMQNISYINSGVEFCVSGLYSNYSTNKYE